jgi:hypothetical protein
MEPVLADCARFGPYGVRVTISPAELVTDSA